MIVDSEITEGEKVGWFKRKKIFLTLLFIAIDHKDNKTYPESGQRFFGEEISSYLSGSFSTTNPSYEIIMIAGIAFFLFAMMFLVGFSMLCFKKTSKGGRPVH